MFFLRFPRHHIRVPLVEDGKEPEKVIEATMEKFIIVNE